MLGWSGVASQAPQRGGAVVAAGSCARAGGRAALRALVVLFALLAWLPNARAAAPLFTFAQISDSQPGSSADWADFGRVLDAIVASGTPGALIPQPIDFVLIVGDLVSHGDNASEWVQWVNTVNAKLTVNGIPYRAVPGNHDVKNVGVMNFEFYVGDSDVSETDTATFVGINGRTVQTGISGLRIIGFNDDNPGWNEVSASDRSLIASKVSAAAAANQNILLFGHHPHDGEGVIPLASVLPNPSICCYVRGHSGSPHAKKGLAGINNPNVWDLGSNNIFDDGAILYYEAYATQLKVYVIQLALNSTSLPAAVTITLPHPLYAAPKPTADFSGTPLAGTAPLNVAFTDLSINGPTAWSWNFGDGGTSTLKSPSHSYASAGVYTVSLTASNLAGSDTKTRTGYVNVNPAPPANTFLPVADARVSAGSPNSNYGSDGVLRLRGGSSAYKSYLRFNVSGLAGKSVLSAKLRLFATDSSDSGGTVYGVANTWTESGITWGTAPSIGGSPLASAGSVAANQWVEYDVTATVRTDGTYSFGLTKSSSTSAYFSSREGAQPPQLVLQTAPSSLPVANFGASPTSGSAPLTVAFTDLSTGGPTSWQWSFGDGGTSTLQNPSHNYASAGAYDVRLTATNGSGSNTYTRSALVQVSAPVPPTADFSGTPLTGTTPLAVAFTDLSTGGATGWQWSFGDGGTSTVRNPSHTYAAAGSFEVTLTASNGAGSNTKVRTGYVNASTGVPTQTFTPVADARVSAGSPGSNYGTDSALRAKVDAYTSYLRFDVSALAGVGVVSAKLRLQVTDASSNGGTAYAVGSSWTETGITWSTAPAIASGPLGSAGAVAAGQWAEYDVTAAVPSGGSVSFAIASPSTDSVYFSSREGANAPQLVVQTGTAQAPVADFSGSPVLGPAPLAVSFTDLSTGGPTTWLWSFGDGATSAQQSPSHSYASPGSYTVSLTASNAQGSNTRTRTSYVAVGQAAPTQTFAPAADAKVSEASPGVNYGTTPDLRLRTNTSGGSYRSFLRFDVSGLSKAVVKATLRLHVDDGSADGGVLHPVPTTWTEGAINWTTAPALDAPAVASLGAVATGTWVEVDVTAAVTGNGSYAFGLANDDSDSAYYGSRESANPPQLVIQLAP